MKQNSDIGEGFKEKFKMTRLMYFKRLHDIVEDRKQLNNLSLMQEPTVSGHLYYSSFFFLSHLI